MRIDRVRAPSEDGGVVVVPEPSTISGKLAANRELLDDWRHDFQGRTSEQLRSMARAQVGRLASEFHERLGLSKPPLAADSPLVVTGHQPELFHPGVWAKNFAARQIANQSGGSALNLIVDIDVPHRHGIRVPSERDGVLRAVQVDFDQRIGERPYEDETVHDAASFRSFPDRVREALGFAISDPVIDRFWPHVERVSERTELVGLRFSAARNLLEVEAGYGTGEVTLSSVCETEAFAWFVSHVLAHLERFRRVHNEALDDYRVLYQIRSHHHPVPDLELRGEWAEAPFWVWRQNSQRRKPLLVRQLAHTMELRIPGEDEPFVELPLSADREACCAVDRLVELPSCGIRLRSRALTTTMFARLLLGDLFVHGIGGAKYDEVSDEIIRRFFEFKPPVFVTLSMTIELGVPAPEGEVIEEREVREQLREVQFNPDRQLTGPIDGEAAAVVEARARAIAGPVETRAQRVERFERIRECNQRLGGYLKERQAELMGRLVEAEAQERFRSVARSREYSFVLHSQRKLRQALLGDLSQVLSQD